MPTLGFTVTKDQIRQIDTVGGARGFGFTSPLPEPFIGPQEPPARTFCTTLETRVAINRSTVQNTRGWFGRRGLVAPVEVR